MHFFAPFSGSLLVGNVYFLGKVQITLLKINDNSKDGASKKKVLCSKHLTPTLSSLSLRHYPIGVTNHATPSLANLDASWPKPNKSTTNINTSPSNTTLTKQTRFNLSLDKFKGKIGEVKEEEIKWRGWFLFQACHSLFLIPFTPLSLISDDVTLRMNHNGKRGI